MVPADKQAESSEETNEIEVNQGAIYISNRPGEFY